MSAIIKTQVGIFDNIRADLRRHLDMTDKPLKIVKQSVDEKTGIESLWIDKSVCDEEMQTYASRFVCNVKLIIRRHTDVYDASSGKLILTFRKKSLKNSRLASENLAVASLNYKRGGAAGPFEPDRWLKYNRKMNKPNLEFTGLQNYYKAFVKGRKDPISNPIESSSLGFLGPKPQDHSTCRQTHLTIDILEGYEAATPLYYEIEKLYASLHPKAFQEQKAALVDIMDFFSIKGTVFTTITVNHTSQTAIHKDTDDIEPGYSPIITTGVFRGLQFCLPQYNLAVDVQPADFLLANVHEFHCNLPEHPDGQDDRYSYIFYARSDVVQGCPEEAKLAQAVANGKDPFISRDKNRNKTRLKRKKSQ